MIAASLPPIDGRACSGSLKRPSMMRLSTWCGLLPENGSSAVASMYSTVPSENRSLRGSTSLPSICSGGMCAGEPSTCPVVGMPGGQRARDLNRNAGRHLGGNVGVALAKLLQVRPGKQLGRDETDLRLLA